MRGKEGFKECLGMWRNENFKIYGGLKNVVKEMWEIMIEKGFNIKKKVCKWLISNEIMMRKLVLLKSGERMGRLG